MNSSFFLLPFHILFSGTRIKSFSLLLLSHQPFLSIFTVSLKVLFNKGQKGERRDVERMKNGNMYKKSHLQVSLILLSSHCVDHPFSDFSIVSPLTITLFPFLCYVMILLSILFSLLSSFIPHFHPCLHLFSSLLVRNAGKYMSSEFVNKDSTMNKRTSPHNLECNNFVLTCRVIASYMSLYCDSRYVCMTTTRLQ